MTAFHWDRIVALRSIVAEAEIDGDWELADLARAQLKMYGLA